MSLFVDKKENSKEFVNSTLSEIQVTQCPVPTATGISLKRGALIEKFEQYSIDVAEARLNHKKTVAVQRVKFYILSAKIKEGMGVPSKALFITSMINVAKLDL